MNDPHELYEQYCLNLKIKPESKVTRALIDVSRNGELNISGMSLTSQTCEVLSKVLHQSKDVAKLNIGDCLLVPQGLASFLSVMHLSSVHTLQLRGNNIGGPSVYKLSKMLSRTCNIKNLGLEWNNLGLCSEGMIQFCNALAVNRGLEVLDLRNNQLDEGCADLLAGALRKNTVLRVLDVRWNSMEQSGGQHFFAAFHTNKTLTCIKLQGNSISNELLSAIDQCALHNSNLLRLESTYEARKEVLANQVKAISSQRVNDLQEWADKNQRQVDEMDAKVKEVQGMLSSKQEQIDNLERAVRDVTREKETAHNKVASLTEELKMKEENQVAAMRDYQLQLDILNKALAANKSSLTALESKLEEDKELRSAMGKDRMKDKEKIRQLEADIAKGKEELQTTISEHIEAIEQERKQSVQRLELVVEEWRGRLDQMSAEHGRAEQVYRERMRALESALEAAEQSRTEQNTQWANERAKWAEEKANIWAEAKEKENYKFLLLTEKVEHLKEEKSSLEGQLGVANTTAQQLQRDNSSIMADLAELRRKLSTVQEELSIERLTVQKLRSEKGDDLRTLETMKAELSGAQKIVTEANLRLDELHREIRRLTDRLEDKERQISVIRKEEKDRAGMLVTAIKSYIDQVNSTNG